jgi:hypothetical protein
VLGTVYVAVEAMFGNLNIPDAVPADAVSTERDPPPPKGLL